MIIDPIGDLLTRIRNAYMARLITVRIPYSKMKADIVRILKKNKYIADFSVDETDAITKNIVVTLNNVRETKYVPTLTRISKPGQRIYI
jgi:small subunit ribosomal protein S8